MHRVSSRSFILFWCLVIALVIALASAAQCQNAEGEPSPAEETRSYATFPVIRTESPGQTLESALALQRGLAGSLQRYAQDRTWGAFVEVFSFDGEIRSLIDLSEVPPANRHDAGLRAGLALLDVLDLTGPIDAGSLPDTEAMSEGAEVAYAVPGTPFQLRRMEEGARRGEYLFAGNTVEIAPRYLARLLARLPEAEASRTMSETIAQLTGPMIPRGWVSAVPRFLGEPIFGTPGWKVMALVLAAVVIFVPLQFAQRHAVAALNGRVLMQRVQRLLGAAATLVGLLFLRHFADFQLNVAGAFSDVTELLLTIGVFVVLAWLSWLACFAFFEVTMLNRRISEGGLDRKLLYLMARFVGLIGVFWILAAGAQSLGLPLLSLLTGLGIGGLAIALAVRPTLENLIAGFVLFLDKPIRVGDFCTFGSQNGTVEDIGARSTKVRALDRTLITIPNSQFADMQLVNWAQCDRMMIDLAIGLRYETDTDQLRFVLAEIRRMMHGHPRIDNETIRVRFQDYGASSLDISVRVYAMTREWNDFYAIREDVLLRIKEIVEESGTGFAFPSQTLYLARDEALDIEKSTRAMRAVEKWRRNRELPFPRFSSKMRAGFEDRLSYPPAGSPDSAGSGLVDAPSPEPLSTGSEPLSSESPASDKSETEGAEEANTKKD